MDFATAPCILDAVSQRLAHGVFGYSRWRNEAFLGAIAHWYASRFNSDIDPQSVVYGPSVIYMVAETIRQWSKEGDGVVVHTPAYDAFYNTIDVYKRQTTDNITNISITTFSRWSASFLRIQNTACWSER